MSSKGLAGIFLFLFVLTGCSSSKAPEAKTNLTVWHWMTDRQPAFRELSDRYFAQTGVRVNFELYAPSDAYSEKVRSAGQGVNLPDIFGVLGEKRDFASFVKAGHVLNLTPYMDEAQGAWKNKFFDKALGVDEFPEGNVYGVLPGIYAVPIDITTIKLLYNKGLLKVLGLNPEQPPQTFPEFIEAGSRLAAVNRGGKTRIQGFICGWSELWLINCFANNYAFNIMGKDKVLATIRGEVPYTDPDWVRVLALFKEMRESGILAEGIVTMVNKTAEQIFATGKAVFAFNGSWSVNVYKGMNPDLNYAVMLPPKASDKYPMSIWGSAGSSFMVNARSKNKEEAVKFLKWLTESAQQSYLAQTTLNLPANKECLGQLPPVLAQFAKDMELTTHPNTWDVYESPLVIEALDKGIQSIVIGEKTPEEAAAGVQKIKAREQAKKRVKS